ncbi:MAG: hypothetical protein ACRD98_06655, partial [Nitrososphaera sp.]
VSLGISLAISALVPFPLSIIAIFGVFLAMGYYIRRRQLQRIGATGGAHPFASMSSSEGTAVNYLCMNCGTKHKEIACPKCGSKSKRASFI